MTAWLLPIIFGFATGVVSAFGVGGGTLLLLCMTLFLDVDTATAQTINLLYFLPTAAISLLFHKKNGYLNADVAKASIPFGILFAIIGAWIGAVADMDILHKLFGAFLVYAGISLLFSKNKAEKSK